MRSTECPSSYFVYEWSSNIHNPTEWFIAHIIPVFKKGVAGDVSNYRPISLTCVPCEIMQTVNVHKILDYLRFQVLMI